MVTFKTNKHIPALGFDFLTPVYDPVVRWTTREILFKTELIKQAQIAPDQQILDLGCGTGTLTVLIKRKFPQTNVFGLDSDAKVLQIAESKAKKSGSEIQFEKGLSDALPYADESFDRVVSSLFFHHLTRENKLKTLREVFRVLKPNGELHIADWGCPANFLMKFLSRAIELLDGAETTSDNFKGLLSSWVAEADFRETEERLYFNSLFGTIRLLKTKK